MARTIRFHLDENCHRAIAEGLRRRGVDITTTPDVGVLHASDDQQSETRHAADEHLADRSPIFLQSGPAVGNVDIHGRLLAGLEYLTRSQSGTLPGPGLLDPAVDWIALHEGFTRLGRVVVRERDQVYTNTTVGFNSERTSPEVQCPLRALQTVVSLPDPLYDTFLLNIPLRRSDRENRRTPSLVAQTRTEGPANDGASTAVVATS